MNARKMVDELGRKINQLIKTKNKFEERGAVIGNDDHNSYWLGETAKDLYRAEATLAAMEKEYAEGLFRWQWNNQIGSRGRAATCIVVDCNGIVYRFAGTDIPKVAKVVNSSHEKNGKWSNTTYTVLSRQGTVYIPFRQDFENGQYWPQASWEEAIGWVKSTAKNASEDSIKKLIRSEWPSDAGRFDSSNDDDFFG